MSDRHPVEPSVHRPLEWHLPRQVVRLARPLVMGIVNVTPDSFSDGGRHATSAAAIAHGLRLVEQGADLLDIGGESTRPGAQPVPPDEELRRVLPVVEALTRQVAVPLSVDTFKAAIARQALEAGAQIINDVTALTGDPDMAEVLRSAGAGLVLMHMQGTPATMQDNPHYDDVVAEIGRFFEERLRTAAELGIAGPRVVLDPGIGFGKTVAHNLEILARLTEFQALGRPVCLGVSRKGFIGRLLNRSVDERLAGSLAIACYAILRGAVQILRVHDVQETRDAVSLLSTIETIRERGA
jgi:dihydropteroate synthase